MNFFKRGQHRTMIFNKNPDLALETSKLMKEYMKSLLINTF